MSQLTVGFAMSSMGACSSQQAALQDVIGLDPTIRAVWYTILQRGQTVGADRVTSESSRTPSTAAVAVAQRGIDPGIHPHAWVCDGPAIFALPKSVVSRGTLLTLVVNATPRQCRAVIASAERPTTSRHRLDALRHWWHSQVFRRAQLVVARSDWAARSLVDDYGIDPRRLVVIPPGLDLAAWRPNLNRAAAPTIRVLCVAEHLTAAGAAALRACLASADLNRRCEFHVVTRDPLPSGLTGVVRHDWVRERECPSLYRNVDIFMLLSPSEEFPGTVVKAMAAGLPVIAERLTVLEETIEEGRSGILVPRHDEQALAQALGRLTAEFATRQEMGQRGRELAEVRFDAARNCRRLLRAIKTLIAHDRGNGGSDPVELYV